MSMPMSVYINGSDRASSLIEKVCVDLQMCEIEVLHKSASRVHACIAFDTKQQPFIVDLRSTHGESRTGIMLKTPILLRCRKI